MKNPIKIAITGATGMISYSVLFRLAAGEAFGADQPVILQFYDLPGTEKVMEGLAMELEDCCTSLVAGIEYGSDLTKIFKESDYALLIGAKPRGPGMERAQLLTQNGAIFVKQGQALDRVAKRTVKVLVVGNPCNTNCLVAMHHAPDLKRKNFHALLRLDQNRAQALLAKKANVRVDEVKGVVVWGNHSATQVPDVESALIKGKPATQVIQDQSWLQGTFLQSVQKRGASVIDHLGRSSAASAAKAIVDAVRSIHVKTPKGEWFTSGVCTDENPYGLPEGLIFGLPCQSDGQGGYTVVSELPWDSFIQEKVNLTLEELIAERAYCIKEGLLS